jgi:hypothetical protein
MHMSKTQEFKKWCAERMGHPHQIQLALEAVLELEKRVQSLDKAVAEEIENRDNWEERATKLAVSVGEYFDESVGEHSSANCPIDNAHELLNQIRNEANGVITPESIQSIIDYINEGDPNLNVIKGELGELIARHNGTYHPADEQIMPNVDEISEFENRFPCGDLRGAAHVALRGRGG